MSDIKIKPSDGVIGSPTDVPRKYPLDQMKVNEEFETGPILSDDLVLDPQLPFPCAVIRPAKVVRCLSSPD